MIGQPVSVAAWITANNFTAEPGTILTLPDASGGIAEVLFGSDSTDPWCWANLPAKLPSGVYHVNGVLDAHTANWLALVWELGCYQFNRYSATPRSWPTLLYPSEADHALSDSLIEAHYLTRDLINTPAQDMGPNNLVMTAARLAEQHGASLKTIVGEALIEENYPLIHAVGRASTRAPCLIDLRWGDENNPKVTLIGKGVCFDSGGLDIKPSSAMKLMKKDMGGAAHVLSLAQLIMARKLSLRLRVLIPAVDNVISGNAFRPLDVLRSRKGLTIEVGNTDAEGRLILADALAEADGEKPDLLIDFATLTGAARSALGPELPALFTNRHDLAFDLQNAGTRYADPLWQLPLWKPYRRMLNSTVADIGSVPDSGQAGAITAALFLNEFVSPETPWIHLDIFGWNPTARPGRPEGGEAFGLRALFHFLAQRYPS